MAIVWNKLFEIGVEKIDLQHQELYSKVNDLYEACRRGEGKQYIGNMLEFLEKYTKHHFSDEEELMISINYPEISSEIKQHRDFIAEIAKLREEFEKTNGNLTIVLKANSMVTNWLNNHISVEDKKIGEFIKNTK